MLNKLAFTKKLVVEACLSASLPMKIFEQKRFFLQCQIVFFLFFLQCDQIVLRYERNNRVNLHKHFFYVRNFVNGNRNQVLSLNTLCLS